MMIARIPNKLMAYYHLPNLEKAQKFQIFHLLTSVMLPPEVKPQSIHLCAPAPPTTRTPCALDISWHGS